VKVLVTGASGFVGSRLISRLVVEGFDVRATYRRVAPPSRAGLEAWPLPNLDDEGSLEKVVAGCDAIVHLAALAHQQGSRANRLPDFLAVNAEGTRLLARAAARAGVGRFIFVSSIAAVCTRSVTPVDDRTPSRPTDPYGRSKLEGERALIAELNEAVTDWCILRPPLIYGPGNPGNMRRLLGLIEHGWPLLLGSIRNRRSFAFVDNLVDALVTVLRHGRSVRSTFVFSDGSDLSTPELIRALADAAGVRLKLWPFPIGLLLLLGRMADGARMLCGVSMGVDSIAIDRLIGSLPVDGERFREFFAWRPVVKVDQALRRTGQSLRAEDRKHGTRAAE